MEFGCIFSQYDARDYRLVATAVNESSLPEEYIIDSMGAVKNQGSVGSCVAHALSSIMEYHAGYMNKELSTNFIYGIQKELFNRDERGMILRDACDIALSYGDMLTVDCPGNDEVPICHNIASNALDDESKAYKAYAYRISSYYLCNSIEDIKYALINHGPVLGALKWYREYKVDSNGILSGHPKTYSGGHAVVIYGYNKTGFLCQNSWGKYWGDSGKFIIPYETTFTEARGIVDYKTPSTKDVKKHHNGTWWNILYKAVNIFVNFILKIIRK